MNSTYYFLCQFLLMIRIFPFSLMSSNERPTLISNSPGSTVYFISVFHSPRLLYGMINSKRFSSLGLRLIFSNHYNKARGVTTLDTTSLTNRRGVSLPARVPVFLTLKDILRSWPGAYIVSISRLEYSNWV